VRRGFALVLTFSGLGGCYFFCGISFVVEVVGECGFAWVVGDVLGKWAVEASLVSVMVMKCDAVWLEVD
jgi:hypothetical protein